MKDFSSKNIAYDCLKSVFNGAYSSIELDHYLSAAPSKNRAYVTAIVYSVLGSDIRLSYILDSLCEKKPKQSIIILLKMALAEIEGSSRPREKIINEYVAFAKERFRGTEKFVNGVLARAPSVELPIGTGIKALSIKYSCPEWVVEKLFLDYGELVREIIATEYINKTHIRNNSNYLTRQEFDELVSKADIDAERTELGWFVTRKALSALDEKTFTAQSHSSIVASEIFYDNLSAESKVLDLCAAPGGKAIYIAEKTGANVTACDIHEHRVNLIKSYAARMGVRLKALQNDATVINKEWASAFDAVICDAPCSGSGLLKSSPDILLFKGAQVLDELSGIQLKILLSAANYVKKGGYLYYATCSIFKAENEDVISKFLALAPNFSLSPVKLVSGLSEASIASSGVVKIMPSRVSDGFSIFKMVRK